jgi:hypothetical protein
MALRWVLPAGFFALGAISVQKMLAFAQEVCADCERGIAAVETGFGVDWIAASDMLRTDRVPLWG